MSQISADEYYKLKNDYLNLQDDNYNVKNKCLELKKENFNLKQELESLKVEVLREKELSKSKDNEINSIKLQIAEDSNSVSGRIKQIKLFGASLFSSPDVSDESLIQSDLIDPSASPESPQNSELDQTIVKCNQKLKEINAKNQQILNEKSATINTLKETIEDMLKKSKTDSTELETLKSENKRLATSLSYNSKMLERMNSIESKNISLMKIVRENSFKCSCILDACDRSIGHISTQLMENSMKVKSLSAIVSYELEILINQLHSSISSLHIYQRDIIRKNSQIIELECKLNLIKRKYEAKMRDLKNELTRLTQKYESKNLDDEKASDFNSSLFISPCTSPLAAKMSASPDEVSFILKLTNLQEKICNMEAEYEILSLEHETLKSKLDISSRIIQKYCLSHSLETKVFSFVSSFIPTSPSTLMDNQKLSGVINSMLDVVHQSEKAVSDLEKKLANCQCGANPK